MCLWITRLQLEILEVLWTTGPSTVAQVRSRLMSQRRLAYSTVATILSRMERKGLLYHEKSGRAYLYGAAVTQSQVQQAILSDLVDRLFDGKMSRAIGPMLEAHDVDSAELDEISAVVQRYREQRRARRNSQRKTGR
jgi:predicted transcriptional regulator